MPDESLCVYVGLWVDNYCCIIHVGKARHCFELKLLIFLKCLKCGYGLLHTEFLL